MTTLQRQAADGTPARPVAPQTEATESSLDAQLPALRQRLLRQARFAVSDHSLAEDLVQDTLIAVVEEHTTRRGDASLATWATAILKNKVADWYRSPLRQRMVQFEADENELEERVDALYAASGAYVDPVPAWQQPENREEQRQMMTVLDRCVSHLPRQSGRVFMMREWLGFETIEICERTAISAQACRTILHRARTSLRDCMQRNWIDPKAKA